MDNDGHSSGSGSSGIVPPDTIVLSGGGPDGTSFIGCVKYLEEMRPVSGLSRLRTVVGCSVGSIVALMLTMGMDSAGIRRWFVDGVDSGDITDVDIEGVLEVAERLGVDDGRRMMDAVARVLAQLPSGRDTTFRDLAMATGRCLVVCVSNLTLTRKEMLSVDTAPTMPVLLAIRMSISVPFIFMPVMHNDCVYVDGGIFDFCPLDHLAAAPRSATSTLVLRVCPCECPQQQQQQQRNDHTAPSSRPALSTYLSLLVRALVLRPSTGFVSACSSSNRAPALVTEVNVPSLMDVWGTDGTESPVCAFSMRSMSLHFTPDALDRYTANGHAAMVAALTSVVV